MHQDNDSEMTVQFLHQIVNDANSLLNLLDPNLDLEDWVDFKVSRARQDLADIKSYLEYHLKTKEPISLINTLQLKGYSKAVKILEKRAKS